VFWWLVACGEPQVRCGVDECSEVCASTMRPDAAKGPMDTPATPPAVDRSVFEQELLAAALQDVRDGVRPWDERAIGVCAGKKECKEYLGTDAGELPPGDYVVRAELRVPASGEKGTWKVKFASECTLERPQGEPTISTYSREYDVTYAGPDRGFRLLPLRAFESPAKEGRQSCKWTLTAPHPSGSGERVWEGGWKVPGRYGR
jgi:hypothetical protein